MKAIIYGTGQFYKDRRFLIPEDMEIAAYADSSPERATSASGNLLEGKPILKPSELESAEYDVLLICTDYFHSSNIFQVLKNYKIDLSKVRFLNRIGATDDEWNYEILSDGTILSAIGNVKIHEKKRTDFDTVAEVFAGHTYHINIPEDSVVIDLGMNVGIASLFFASHHRVKKVYGFEPFPDTYQMALDNFNLNEDTVRNKIIPENAAVTDKNEDMEVAVETEQPGWRSLFENNKDAPKIKIRCRKASDVVREIMEANPEYHYILKCDTEGSEFSIFESLGKTDLLGKLDAIVMEYHRNPKPILDLLETWGYRWYQSGTNLLGNITGFRVK